MRDKQALHRLLDRIDGRSYPAYRDMKGHWTIEGVQGGFELFVDHVQGDPFAAPSRVRVRALCGVRVGHPDATVAAEDWLLRRFSEGLRPERGGSGRSGELRVYRPGPEIVERSAVRLLGDGLLEIRFTMGLPARGRRILSSEARNLIFNDIPAALESIREVGNDPGLFEQVRSVMSQRHLRRQLQTRGLVAFVADGSVLPRASGVEAHPLPGAVQFVGPASLRVVLPTPNGDVSGMGLSKGVTLIVGGGFHGKSTLLNALQTGHLDFVVGDGRERVVTRPHAVKVRAEDGRSVQHVDISPFLGELPGGVSTRDFSTRDASGSTSQAAGLVEAVGAGADILLMDEDTSATNLLVRDERMSRLIPDNHEPIVPLVRRIRALYEVLGVSTVMVVGGVGDFLGVADTVIAMHEWRAADVSAEAKGLGVVVAAAPSPLRPPPDRFIEGSLGRPRIGARTARSLRFGDEDVDVVGVEQVLDACQLTTIGRAIVLLTELADGRTSMSRLLDALEAILDDEGVEALSPWAEPSGDLVRPRRHEIGAVINRMRTLTVVG